MTEQPEFSGDLDIEEPDADAAEQGAATTATPAGRPVASDTVEANEADLAEQLDELPEDEDEYR